MIWIKIGKTDYIDHQKPEQVISSKIIIFNFNEFLKSVEYKIFIKCRIPE